jgi:hypothetical protein
MSVTTFVAGIVQFSVERLLRLRMITGASYGLARIC